jgi:hypothetical protein
MVYEDIWIASDARPPDKVIVLTPEQHQRKVSLANRVYPTALRDGKIGIKDLCQWKPTARYLARVSFGTSPRWRGCRSMTPKIRGAMPFPRMYGFEASCTSRS